MATPSNTTTTRRTVLYYAACYPHGRHPGQPRTVRGFYSLARRGEWIADRLSDFPEAWGYRCTLQAADLTTSERRAVASLARSAAVATLSR